MPGFDGRGPMGQGPRTGGGRGFCAPGSGPFPCGGYFYGRPSYRHYPYSSYPYGFGLGVGRGGFPRGGGRGRAFGGDRRWWW